MQTTNKNLNNVLTHPKRYRRIKFTGNGGDYFKIWIVNMFLTIATLTLYRPWAKIRNKKYLYSHTTFNGARFDYHAKPIPILKGQVIAIIFTSIYIFGPNINPIFNIIGIILFAASLPFFFSRSIKFNSAMSSFRNIRFSFRGSTKQAYMIYFKYLSFPLFCNLSVAILTYINFQDGNVTQRELQALDIYPLIIGLNLVSMIYYVAIFSKLVSSILDYTYNNLYYGKKKVFMNVTKQRVSDCIIKPYIGYSLKMLVITTGLVIGSLVIGSRALIPLNPFFSKLTFLVLSLWIYLMVFFVSIKIPYLMTDFVWKNLKYNGAKTTSTLDWDEFKKIALQNLFITGFSVGLLYPFAKIRMLQYKLRSRAIQDINIEQVIAEEREVLSALGDEMADAFDFDISIGF